MLRLEITYNYDVMKNDVFGSVAICDMSNLVWQFPIGYSHMGLLVWHVCVFVEDLRYYSPPIHIISKRKNFLFSQLISVCLVSLLE
jgi:hypothetical protein